MLACGCRYMYACMHACLCVCMDSALKRNFELIIFSVSSTWGNDWGRNGYVKMKRGEKAVGFGGIPTSITCIILLLNYHTVLLAPRRAGSPVCCCMPSPTTACSPLVSSQACTSTWLSSPQGCGRQVRCVQHSREASHSFP